MTSQYETNLWSTHVNIVRLAEPISRCVRWRTRGVCLQAFPSFPFPSPSPLFHFFDRSSVFLCSETKRKRLLRRLTAKKNYLGFATPWNVLKLFFWDKIGHAKSVSFWLGRLLDEVRLSGKLFEISRDYFEFFDLFEEEIIIIIWAWNDCATATQGGL